MSWNQNVYSSVVSVVGYDSDTESLLITWKSSGKVSAYANVPEEKALECANAPSVGRFVIDEIKPYFQHRYV